MGFKTSFFNLKNRIQNFGISASTERKPDQSFQLSMLSLYDDTAFQINFKMLIPPFVFSQLIFVLKLKKKITIKNRVFSCPVATDCLFRSAM